MNGDVHGRQLLAVLAVIAYIIIYKHRRKSSPADDVPVDDTDEGPAVLPYPALMERIRQLMDEEQPYLRNGLKVQDVAEMLGSNSKYVSECINSVRSQSFSQFVNTYRIRHAQELLRQQPDMKTAALAEESGFSTETTFFRNFKIVTGMTPREWLTTLAQGQQ